MPLPLRALLDKSCDARRGIREKNRRDRSGLFVDTDDIQKPFNHLLCGLRAMSDITDEVGKAIEALGLVPEVQRLPELHERHVYSELVDEFLNGTDRRWWWEAFTKASASVSFPDGTGFKHISELVPSAMEPCWFMVEDSESETYPIYEATPELASKVIGECFAFEYYLIAKDKRWLLCENHHGRVIGVGPEVVEAINHVAA